MFYEGTLQSGIGQAIQQQKLVACFVRDDSATSKRWEDEWLKSGWISSLLEQKAILLRLEHGSTEAGFLAAFCKIESAPTLVVIHNGKLRLQLGSEVGQDEFVNSVRKVLGAAAIPGSAPAQASTAQAEDDLYGDEEPTTTAIPPTRPVSSPAPARAPPPALAPTPATPSTTSNAKGKQRAEATPQAGLAASSTTTNSAQQAARAALQKKKREDAQELARIKARIEQDKAERRAQAEARKAEREQERTASSQAQTQSRTTTSTRGSQAQNVNLNVRLFDGRTIRSTFPRTATLEKEVRTWIDEEFARLDSDDPNVQNRALPPYFFRHILAPQPSRELSAGDENQTLGDIDLAPSATLVLVPVKGYTDAYSGSGTNLLAGTTTGIVGSAFGLLSSTVGYAGGLLGSFLGTGAAAPQPNEGQAVGGGGGSGERSENSRSEREEQGGIRVRTLADQRAREPRSQQFYNGNQSNVEPRPDDRG
ncbi:hypothetical protein BU25DRAFT_441103 [Macroventuria anomochaeta]|uniref:Uncharacterized protein n=1 Tax=Macroventuria anomochaeta TaxID=301207 RepID=A0ACB6RXX2_9PLEO|nr:uncharacterized protein BU25DRAFT_441103 [Macroventuria anomochaeta]KAF2625994.1 hypothetical protein BU25DRAFT_441103 [Macroventuria anomochaeta]